VNKRLEGVARHHNPVVGEVSLLLQTFADVRAPGQFLYMFSAPAGSPDERSLVLLSGTIGPRASPGRSREPAYDGRHP